MCRTLLSMERVIGDRISMISQCQLTGSKCTRRQRRDGLLLLFLVPLNVFRYFTLNVLKDKVRRIESCTVTLQWTRSKQIKIMNWISVWTVTKQTRSCCWIEFWNFTFTARWHCGLSLTLSLCSHSMNIIMSLLLNFCLNLNLYSFHVIQSETNSILSPVASPT